jgi:hypothetical protein
MTERRYTKRQKVAAVVAAVASSTLAASEGSGIPESTLRYWMNNPEFAEIREKAREELAPLASTVAVVGWIESLRLLREHKLDPHDVIFLTGLATDKSQLLNGLATARTETKALTDGLDDHEKDALRAILREAIGEGEGQGAPEGSPEAAAGGVGARVRE